MGAGVGKLPRHLIESAPCEKYVPRYPKCFLTVSAETAFSYMSRPCLRLSKLYQKTVFKVPQCILNEVSILFLPQENKSLIPPPPNPIQWELVRRELNVYILF